jgi:hypothetical protein
MVAHSAFLRLFLPLSQDVIGTETAQFTLYDLLWRGALSRCGIPIIPNESAL